MKKSYNSEGYIKQNSSLFGMEWRTIFTIKNHLYLKNVLKLITGVAKIWGNIFQESEYSIASFNSPALSTFSQANHRTNSLRNFKLTKD